MAVNEVLAALQMLMGQKNANRANRTQAIGRFGDNLGEFGRGVVRNRDDNRSQADAAAFQEWTNAPPGTPLPALNDPMLAIQAQNILAQRASTSQADRRLTQGDRRLGQGDRSLDIGARGQQLNEDFRRSSLGQNASQFGQSFGLQEGAQQFSQNRTGRTDDAYGRFLEPVNVPGKPMTDTGNVQPVGQPPGPRIPGLTPELLQHVPNLQPGTPDTKRLPLPHEAAARQQAGDPSEAMERALSFLEASRSGAAAEGLRGDALAQGQGQHEDRMDLGWETLSDRTRLAYKELSDRVKIAEIKAGSEGAVDTNWAMAVARIPDLDDAMREALTLAGPDQGRQLLQPFVDTLAKEGTTDERRKKDIAGMIIRLSTASLSANMISTPEQIRAEMGGAIKQLRALGYTEIDAVQMIEDETGGGGQSLVESWTDWMRK